MIRYVTLRFSHIRYRYYNQRKTLIEQDFDAAAELYTEVGDIKRCIQMFLDLKEYDRAKDTASHILKTPESEDLIEVLYSHAKHLLEIKQFKAASEMVC